MYKVIVFILTLDKEPHYSDDLTSLMHHFNTPRTRMRSPDQCSIYNCLFTLFFCKFALWVILDTQNVLTTGTIYVQTFVCQWGYMHVSIALACIFKVTLVDIGQCPINIALCPFNRIYDRIQCLTNAWRMRIHWAFRLAWMQLIVVTHSEEACCYNSYFESWKVNTVAARTLRQFAYNRGSYADYVTGAV